MRNIVYLILVNVSETLLDISCNTYARCSCSINELKLIVLLDEWRIKYVLRSPAIIQYSTSFWYKHVDMQDKT